MRKSVSLGLLAIALIFNYCGVNCEVNEKVGCGWQNPEAGYILTGVVENTANFAEFPWMAALMNVTKLDKYYAPVNVYIGGASLIHPSVVMTAAHTVAPYKAETLKVRAGEWDTKTKEEKIPHQDRDVESIVIHEGYVEENLTHNIALVFLSKPMDLAPNVGLVCLPKPQQQPQAATKCLISSWGENECGKEGTHSTILLKVEMPIVSREDCQDQLHDSRLGSLFELRDTFLCAGEDGTYTCKGDGGSPLVCPMETKDRYVQNGIAMLGIKFNGITPSVFVDVASLREWVDKTMKEKGLETNTYSDY